MADFDKQKIIALVLEELKKRKLELIKVAEGLSQSAKEAPKSMESWSDSSRVEFNLMGNQIRTELANLGKAISFFEKFESNLNEIVQIGSLVGLVNNSEKKYFFLVPENSGGIKMGLYKQEIYTVSVESELGKMLLGKRIGEGVILPNNKKFKIETIA
ncbi:MAG: hypothetical protein AB1721_01540 [Patescibacteria group bacterium]